MVTSAGNSAAAVSKTTCRARGSAVGEIALRLTITTSAQDGSAASARTTAAPTCPVPPMIKTRNAMQAHCIGVIAAAATSVRLQRADDPDALHIRLEQRLGSCRHVGMMRGPPYE